MINFFSILPRLFSALAADGVTRLNGAMYLPPHFDPAKSYPLVDHIYPGPQINWHARRFPNVMGMFAQAVADLGLVVIMIESRGMPNRSRTYHQQGTGNLHQPALSDHVAVIEQLCERHAFLDRDRVGIFGQSGGGYATARALFEHPGLFKVGVAVCGNHDNRHYVSLWLDKYGDRSSARGREQQANVPAAHKLQGKLLLIHGDMDENVHLAHTLELVNALVKAGKPFDLLVVPGASHSVTFESAYAMARLMDYLAQALLQAPPAVQYGPAYSPVDFGTAMQFLMSDMAWS